MVLLAESLQGWAQLGATGVVCALLVWLVTVAGPKVMNSFSQAVKEQRDDFKQELKEHRQQSRQLAESGHDAVRGLTGSFERLSEQLKHLAEGHPDKMKFDD